MFPYISNLHIFPDYRQDNARMKIKKKKQTRKIPTNLMGRIMGRDNWC